MRSGAILLESHCGLRVRSQTAIHAARTYGIQNVYSSLIGARY
jgi:hypothetical protein